MEDNDIISSTFLKIKFYPLKYVFIKRKEEKDLSADALLAGRTKRSFKSFSTSENKRDVVFKLSVAC